MSPKKKGHSFFLFRRIPGFRLSPVLLGLALGVKAHLKKALVPALLAESAGDIQISIGQVNIGELSTEAQLEILGNVEVVQAYMQDPQNEEKREATMEILADPEFVAIRAAFLDALSENISKVMPAALPGFE